jgi:hypothetical protein
MQSAVGRRGSLLTSKLCEDFLARGLWLILAEKFGPVLHNSAPRRVR